MKKRNVTVIAAAMLLMLLTACQQRPTTENDLPSDTEGFDGEEHAAQATEYNLMVISDEYVDVELKTIYSDKIEFSVTSKLKNNEMDLNLATVALDGLVSQERYSDTSFLTIKPQETTTAYYNVDLTYTEHETLSMAAELFNDEGNGVKSYSVYEFPLGKEYHAEYEEPDEKLVYDSDSLSIRYAGAQDKGILLRVHNKKEEAIYFSIDMDFRVNGEDRSYVIGSVPIPAKAWRDRYIDIKAVDMDYLPEEVKSFSCTGHTAPYGGGTRIEEFTINSNTEAEPFVESDMEDAAEKTEEDSESTKKEESESALLSKDAILKRFKKAYLDPQDRKLSKETKKDLEDVTLCQYAILTDDGKVVPCSINILCKDGETADSVIVAYMKNDNSTEAKDIVDVWAYMIAAYDPELSSWQGYQKLTELQDENKITENGYEYTYLEDMLTLIIHHEGELETKTAAAAFSPDAKVSSNVFTPPKVPSSVKEATTGERNALERAKEYLDYSAFSYSGLIEQLEYEGYTNQEATYGADNCGADWNVQAEQCAKDYMEYSEFSQSGLIEQLEYEGFTHSQAVHGAESVGY